MAAGQWMRILDAVGGLVELSTRRGRRTPDEATLPQSGRTGGPLEARLAGVLVAALKEAFDRDSARMELERSQVETESRRADQALRAELRRQAAERALAHLRLIAIIAVCAWALSAALGAWIPGMRATVPRLLLGAGWASIFGALGCAFAGWRSILTWSAEPALESASATDASAAGVSVAVAPWLLLAALALIGASLLFAL